MKRKNSKPAFVIISVVFFSLAGLHAESAKAVIDFILHAESGTEGSVSRIIDELEIAAASAETPADRRSILVFLAEVQEHAGRYADASRNNALAAGIDASPAVGMQRISAQQLAINAVRCALFAGDYQTAESYLSSDVKKSTDPSIQAYIKLYSAWSVLSKAVQTDGNLAGPAALLDAYAKDPALETVRPAVLFTLWFIDPVASRRDALVSRYPNSPEAAVAQGKANILPSPFWYFLLSWRENSKQGTNPNPPLSGQQTLLQLGLFRVQNNAEALVLRLKNAGFAASIITQKRDGQDYFVVTMADSGDTLARLKAAGFEAFPLKNN